MTYEEKQTAIKAAIAEFPEEFGLRAFPGEIFTIVESACYWSGLDESVMLYTYRKLENGRWGAFSKGTPAELRREVVR